MRRRLLASVLALIVSGTSLIVTPTVGTSRASAANVTMINSGHRYLVLVAGICPVVIVVGPGCGHPNERVKPESRTNGFDPVQKALHASGAFPTPIPYSYFIRKGWPNPTYYYAKDTHEPVEVAAYQLETQLRSVVRSDPQATFDLLCHSLGGVVAGYWIAKHADAFMLRKIHSMVTFDSPLQGISSIVAIEGLYGSGKVWFDLIPGSSVLRAINDTRTGVVAKLGQRIHTIGDTDDKVVTSDDSWIGNRHDQTMNKVIHYCPFRMADKLDKIWCHGSSLLNADAVSWAAHWLA